MHKHARLVIESRQDNVVVVPAAADFREPCNVCKALHSFVVLCLKNIWGIESVPYGEQSLTILPDTNILNHLKDF